MTESSIAGVLSCWRSPTVSPPTRLSYLILSIRYYYDSGSVYLLPTSLAVLVVLFDRLGHYEAAATIKRIRQSLMRPLLSLSSNDADRPSA